MPVAIESLTPEAGAAHRSAINDYDLEAVRADFPILARKVYGRPLVYLDSAASAQKPRAVLEAMNRFYETDYANVHRGLHALSQAATDAYEGAREKVRRFLGAASTREIVFTKGGTEAINLVAASWGRSTLRPGDEILLSVMEHHSNIVPWQLVAEQTGAVIRVVPCDEAGNFLFDRFLELLGPRTRMVAVAHMSNALGTILPVERIVEAAHAAGAAVLIDGCQAVMHMAVDVRALGCDFYVFSGHKLYGPTGIGVLWGREALLEAMPPYQGGGDMIGTVSFEGSTWAALPAKFEAGTPAIAEVVGLGAAIDYVTGLGLDLVAAHEADVLAYGSELLRALPGVRIVGEADDKASVLSFVMDGVHPHDIGTIIDREGVAVRAGHHCAQPLMDRFGVPATARASIGLYTSRQEMDALARSLERVRELFG